MPVLNHNKSDAAFSRAIRAIPGGVNSPVRAFKAVGGKPLFISSGKGSHITDIDGNEFIDYVGSWGPLILGHTDPDVVAALCAAAEKGSSFGAPTEAETELAEMIVDAVPSVARVRLVNSGTEATMSAIRLARGFTGRDGIIKFEGCYHGHVDGLLVAAGSGAATFGTPTSPGIPRDYVKHTRVVPFNNLDAVEKLCAKKGDTIACIIVEPVPGNMGLVPPAEGFLQGLRDVCDSHGIVLIFDEVMSGFRVAYGGAQDLYGVTPDMTTLGKVIGGGMPVGAYGGTVEIMDHISPIGGVYQAGTLSGNPLATAAGIATLRKLQQPGVYENLEEKSAKLAAGLEAGARETGVGTFHTRVGSKLCTFFTEGPVTDFESAKESDTALHAKYFGGMLERGVYFAPSQFEVAFMSAAHTDEDIETTIQASREVMKEIAEGS